MLNYTIPGDLVHTKKFEADGSDRILYMGYAPPGAATSSKRWMIKKITYSGTGFITDEQFATGNANFDKAWDDRAAYVYS